MPERIVRMRAAPGIGVGGMYATSANVNDVVRIAAMVPSLFRQQIWKLKSVEEKDTGKYYSISLMDGANHEPWFWSSIGDKPQPHSPVILSTDGEGKVTWRVTPLDNGVKDAYTVAAKVDLIGAVWYAGTVGEHVIFKPLPIDVPDEEKPYWVLTEASPPE